MQNLKQIYQITIIIFNTIQMKKLFIVILTMVWMASPAMSSTNIAQGKKNQKTRKKTVEAVKPNPSDAGWEEMNKVLARIKDPVFKNRDYRITDFYNGKDSLYTDAINTAIYYCSHNGGGRVIVPAGVYKTAPIRLLSNVNLHLEDGAKILFTTDRNLFPVVKTRIEGMDCYNLSPLIYARGAENIAVTGKGILDGQASKENWFSMERLRNFKPDEGKEEGTHSHLFNAKDAETPVEKRVYQGSMGIRPQFINFYECENVLLEDITINNSPFWLIHPLFSKNVILRRVNMHSHMGNNDGCDPESCDGVLIEDCDFNTGDDCIAIKSGRDQDGRRVMIPSQNIIVRNCHMKDGHAGVAIGSEITGGCHHVWVENCTMDSPELGRIIRIKSNAERGGEVHDVYARNITVGAVDLAILGMELTYWRVEDGPYRPYFHDIYLENITSKQSRYALHIGGMKVGTQVRNIFVKDCEFNGVKEKEINLLRGVENVNFDNVKINGKKFELKGDGDREVYLFTGHREPALDGLHFLYSYDGLKWDSIPGSFLRPMIGNDKPYYNYEAQKTVKGKYYPAPMMRDPSIIQGPDGTFHLVWTLAWAGEKAFGYASSKDLINWSEQRKITVMADSVTNNVWAPELFYDDELEQFLIIWSSGIRKELRTEADNLGTNGSHRMYYTTTKDFKTFAETKPYYDPGFNSIDGFLYKRAKNDYVFILKDNRKPEYSDLFCVFGKSPYGPFSNPTEKFAPTYSEGACCYKVGDEYLIYFDVYRQTRYGAVSTKDFKTFTPIDNRIEVPIGQKHGTIFKVKESVLKRLLDASKNGATKL